MCIDLATVVPLVAMVTVLCYEIMYLERVTKLAAYSFITNKLS